MITLYLAHPILSRKKVREWELKTQRELSIRLVNPFYEAGGVERGDIKDIDSGKISIFDRNLNEKDIVEGDLGTIDSCDGTLSIWDENITVGTSMEVFYSHANCYPVISICLREEMSRHPWIKYCSDKIFISFEEFEEYWKKTDFEVGNRKQTIFGIVGKKNSGKDTVGKYLVENHDFKRFAFADELKYVAKRIWGFTSKELEEKPEKVRHVLQSFATEFIRENYPNAWRDLTLRRIENYSYVLPLDFLNVVVTDVRFKNEADGVRKVGGKLIRVNRKSDIVDLHVSETELDEIQTDYEIDNNKDEKHLYNQIEGILREENRTSKKAL